MNRRNFLRTIAWIAGLRAAVVPLIGKQLAQPSAKLSAAVVPVTAWPYERFQKPAIEGLHFHNDAFSMVMPRMEIAEEYRKDMAFLQGETW